MGWWIFISEEERRAKRQEIMQEAVRVQKRVGRRLQEDLDKIRNLAVKAKRINSTQLAYHKSKIKELLSLKRQCEEQQLFIETVSFDLEHAEAMKNLVGAVMTASNAIAKVASNVDVSKMKIGYANAMRVLRQKRNLMDSVLEAFREEQMDSLEGSKNLVSDEEVDRLIDGDAAAVEKDALDERISEGMKKTRDAFGR